MSWIFCKPSVSTLRGNERKHSVQVKTTRKVFLVSPAPCEVSGADSLSWSTAWAQKCDQVNHDPQKGTIAIALAIKHPQ